MPNPGGGKPNTDLIGGDSWVADNPLTRSKSSQPENPQVQAAAGDPLPSSREKSSDSAGRGSKSEGEDYLARLEEMAAPPFSTGKPFGVDREAIAWAIRTIREQTDELLAYLFEDKPLNDLLTKTCAKHERKEAELDEEIKPLRQVVSMVAETEEVTIELAPQAWLRQCVIAARKALEAPRG